MVPMLESCKHRYSILKRMALYLPYFVLALCLSVIQFYMSLNRNIEYMNTTAKCEMYP